MEGIFESLKRWLKKNPRAYQFYKDHESFCKYFITSFLSLTFEIGLVYVLYAYGHLPVVLSNFIGMTIDFLFTYWMSKYVFHSSYDGWGFVTYLATSVLGMGLNTWILTSINNYFYPQLGKHLAFFVGKFFATGIPFFLKYFLRKFYFSWKEKRASKKEDL